MKFIVQAELSGLREWRQPVESDGEELAAIIAEARTAGFEANRMKVLPGVRYELRFIRLSSRPREEPGDHQPSPPPAKFVPRTTKDTKTHENKYE